MADRADPMILNENIYGIRMIRTDMKKRSRVDVVNKNGFKLYTYRMNNVPDIEFVVCGLGLGYPIESTAWSIRG